MRSSRWAAALAAATVAGAMLAAAPTGLAATSPHPWSAIPSATCTKPGSEPAPVGPDSAFYGVGVVSSCNAWAVGYRTSGGVKHTLTEHWNGTKWALVTSPSPGPAGSADVLKAVTVVSKSNIWAVGTVTSPKSPVLISTLIEHWNGTKWTAVPSPNPGGKSATNELNAITAVSASNIWIAGYYIFGTTKSAILHWNGKSWKVVPSPNVASATNGTILTSIVATSPSQAWAAGYACGSTACHPVMLSWNGKKWSFKATAKIAGMKDGYLYGLSARSATAAWAVGSDTTSSGDFALIEHWNGHAWSQMPAPVPAGSASYLFGVVTFSSSSAAAVGYFQSGNESTLIEQWNGKKWTMVPVSFAPFGPTLDYNFLAVGGTSCSDAWAVGQAFVPTPPYNDKRPLSLRC